MPTSTVLSINDTRCRDAALVGGKAANLHQLARIAEVATPDGFVIPTTAYTEYLESLQIEPWIAELQQLSNREGGQASTAISKQRADLCSRIRETIVAGKMSNRIQQEVCERYRSISGRVAVRSSATAEDRPDMSFAGQYSTALNQVGNAQVLTAVQKIWASAYNDRAVDYRDKNGVLHQNTQMAVLVLRMIDARSSGTAFTVDLETGRPLFTIQNSYGLGEAEVSGEMTPDFWLVDPQSDTILKRRLGLKEIRIEYDPSAQVTIRRENPVEWRRRYATDCATIHTIAHHLKHIEAHFRQIWTQIAAIDTEYAVDSGGEVVFLQVRPETAFSGGTTRLLAVDTNKARDRGARILLEGGITGAIGVASGHIRLVFTADEANEKVKSGDIMVAPNTMSVWERPMSVSGGMVTESGGPGGHTALIAREHGKPAIVGNPDALRVLRLHEGRMATVDSVFRRVYDREIPQNCLYQPDAIPTHYLGRDAATEQQAWESATHNGQTMVDRDGTRWIGKPNEATSHFLNCVHAASHAWIARRAGLTPVEREWVRGGVYCVGFADIHRWREELRAKLLEDLERIYALWRDTIREYLAAAQELALNRASVQRWLDAFVGLNGIMNLSFPINEVVSGLREEVFMRVGIREPYLALARYSSGLSEATLDIERSQVYARLLDAVRESTALQQALGPVIAAADAVEMLREQSPEFYALLGNYVRSYRITPRFSLAFTDPLPFSIVAKQLLDDVATGRTCQLSQTTPEEFYPEKADFRRILHLASVSGKLKQDSHHLKFRGQWQFMEVMRPFWDFLVEEGRVACVSVIFENAPSWLLDRLEEFEGDNRVRQFLP